MVVVVVYTCGTGRLSTCGTGRLSTCGSGSCLPVVVVVVYLW